MSAGFSSDSCCPLWGWASPPKGSVSGVGTHSHWACGGLPTLPGAPLSATPRVSWEENKAANPALSSFFEMANLSGDFLSWSRGAVPCTSEAARGHFIEGWAEFAMHKLGGEAAHFPHLEGQRPCPPVTRAAETHFQQIPSWGLMWVLWETSEPQCPQCSPVLPVKAQSGAKGPQSLPRPEAADSPVPLHLCPGPSLRSPPRAAGAGARRAGRGTPGERGAQAVGQGSWLCPRGLCAAAAV